MTDTEAFLLLVIFCSTLFGLLGAVAALIEHPPVRRFLDRKFRWFP